MGIGSIAKVALGKAALPVTVAFGVKDAYDGVGQDDNGALSQAASGAQSALNGGTFGLWGKATGLTGISAPDGKSWGQEKTMLDREAAAAEKHAKELAHERAVKREAYGSTDMGTAAGMVNTAYHKAGDIAQAVGKPLLGAIASGAGAVDHMIDSEHGKVNPLLSAIDAAAGSIESISDHGHKGPDQGPGH